MFNDLNPTIVYAANSLIPILSLLFGYLWASIPNAVIIGKIFYKKDPRDFGSHNPGGTNVIRTLGYLPGVIVILLDMIKSIAPFWIMFSILKFTELNNYLYNDVLNLSIWITAFGCILGHCYSIFLKFKGGKGVATYMGTLGTSNIFQLIFGFITFITTISVKKIVSLGSILVSIFACLISWILFITYSVYPASQEVINLMFLYNPELLSMHWSYPLIVTLMTFILLFRHKENIQRLIKKEEKVNY